LPSPLLFPYTTLFRSDNPFSLVFTLGGFVLLLILAQAVASRPELVDGIGVRVLGWVNSVRGKPAGSGLGRWRAILAQLESVRLRSGEHTSELQSRFDR